MADQLAHHDLVALKERAERTMALVDAMPGPMRLLVHEYHPNPVIWARKNFGDGMVRRACERMRRQGQEELLRSTAGVGAAIARRMKR